jgi:hypothetical protein
LQKRFHFDNIVISRYDQVHGRNSFQRDKTKGLEKDRLELATVDVGAIIDFASSSGTLVLTSAYADCSADVNDAYHPFARPTSFTSRLLRVQVGSIGKSPFSAHHRPLSRGAESL